MRIKESLALDSIIRERANSLAQEPDHLRLVKKAKCLAALIECQEELDEIMANVEPEVIEQTTNVGDIVVNVQGPSGRGNSRASKTPYQPFDGGDIGRATAQAIRQTMDQCES